MIARDFLDICVAISIGLLIFSLILCSFRIARGPTLPDRVLGLDMLTSVGIGYVAVIALRTGFQFYVDIAIALALVGFLATVALARFILQRWSIQRSKDEGEAKELMR
jgi:multicomponent Na+:H+ antiporter subunit F